MVFFPLHMPLLLRTANAKHITSSWLRDGLKPSVGTSSGALQFHGRIPAEGVRG